VQGQIAKVLATAPISLLSFCEQTPRLFWHLGDIFGYALKGACGFRKRLIYIKRIRKMN
jgi:hypothetical protein